MKKQNLLFLSFSALALSALVVGSIPSFASSTSSLNSNGTVAVEASTKTSPLDPENPGTAVDPGEGPSTDGTLRIDFASSLNFGSAVITDTNRVYTAQAQLFLDDTGARGSYIQITDLREGTPGWSLLLKQDYQFRNTIIQEADNQELNGAVLSLDNGWANSSGTGIAPNVQRDTIQLDNIGSSYLVATAASGAGNGTWTIEFGASSTNSSNQTNTLTPLTDAEGNAVMDTTYSKQAESNSAITLSIPDTTNINAVQYETKLTWILQATP